MCEWVEWLLGVLFVTVAVPALIFTSMIAGLRVEMAAHRYAPALGAWIPHGLGATIGLAVGGFLAISFLFQINYL